MKKLLVTAAVALALTGAAFAQKSNTKTATAGLIDDNIVDAIDTGNGEDKTLVFFGYNHSDQSAEAGWGHQFGGLWFSLYDGYSFKGSKKKTDEVWSDTVASDGVNTDYVDEGETAEWNIKNAFKNTMRVALAWNNSVGASFYWKADHKKYTFDTQRYGKPQESLSRSYYDPSDDSYKHYYDYNHSGETTTANSSENHADGTTETTEWDTLKGRENINTFGLDFNGMKIGGSNFYAKLNAIDVTLGSINRDAAWTTTRTLNGSTVGAGKQESYDGEYNDIAITPRIDVEFGLGGFRLFDAVQTNFVLKEEFTPTFYTYDDTYDLTEVTETNTIKETIVMSQEVTNDDRFDWENTLTPRFNFTYDADERLTLKSRIDIPVTFGNKHSGAQDYEYNKTTTYYDKTSGTSTSIVKTTTGAGTSVSSPSGQRYDEDVFTTTVAPALSFGAVYKLVPGKFNLNIGAKLNTGALVWTTTERTYSDQVQTEVTKTTDEYGNTSTSVSTESSKGNSMGDTTGPNDNSLDKNRVTKEFTSELPTGEAYLGGTWFLTDHVQLDMLLGTATSANSNFTWKLNVAFGLHF